MNFRYDISSNLILFFKLAVLVLHLFYNWYFKLRCFFHLHFLFKKLARGLLIDSSNHINLFNFTGLQSPIKKFWLKVIKTNKIRQNAHRILKKILNN